MDEDAADFLQGICPDAKCQTLLYFTSKNSLVECKNCGQQHKIENLLEQKKANKINALQSMIKNMTDVQPKKGSDFVRVIGLSNFLCKLLSPLLTTYGMNKAGKATLLSELCDSETIDCGKVLGNRTFLISPAHIDVEGYGKDRTGSTLYLQTLLDELKSAHEGEERLIPIHADGDGHCLVHAISRSLIGRELFWHGLRINLQNHLKEKLEIYKEMFKEFHDDNEWAGIIEEADPYRMQFGIAAGLGNIHIFALSNILKRPIMLLDSMKNLQNAGDYTGLFVPVMVEPEECMNKSPICIAWSGGGHHHFVALVAIQGRQLPQIPKSLVPRIWGVSQEVGQKYLDFNEDGSLTVCAGKPLSQTYIQKLVSAMESLFIDSFQISPTLVADYCQQVYKKSDVLEISPEMVTNMAQHAVDRGALFMCLFCQSLKEITPPLSEDLCPGGQLYNLMVNCHKEPKEDKTYSFPIENLQCKYDKEKKRLVVFEYVCPKCDKALREVNKMGAVAYRNGDATVSSSTSSAKCESGQKYYWDGKEYDNLPEIFFINAEWGDRLVKMKITWFYGDSNPEYNSNATDMARELVEEHFPGEFGVGMLVEQIATKLRCMTCMLNSINGEEFHEMTYQEVPDKTQNTLKKEDSSLVQKKRPAKMPKTKPATKQTESRMEVEVSPTKTKETGKQIIKISSSGLDSTITVNDEIDLNKLKSIISTTLNIPVHNQVLKLGYPPKTLGPSEGPLGLKTGDLIKVSEKSSGKDVKQPKLTLPSLPKQTKTVPNISSPKQSTPDFTPPELSRQSSLNKALHNIRIEQSQSKHKTMWDFAVERPQLFTKGGVFYKQFERDIGLKDGFHCQLPLIPNKLFMFSEKNDRVELCLEPRGHFPVNKETDKLLFGLSSAQTKVAPGFGMLGDSPATLPKEDILAEREKLQKLIKKESA